MGCRNISSIELRKLNGPLNVEREELRMTCRFLSGLGSWVGSDTTL